MANVFTAKDAEAYLKNGKSLADVPSGTVITPGARDLLRVRPGKSASVAQTSGEPIIPDYEFHWEAGKDPKTNAEIQAFFKSPAIETLKERMCEMGKRMWAKDYTDGNGGNLTIRVGDNLVLCTPTLISKGHMTPEHMCLVDMDGKQLAGRYKRTSECMTHLGVMKRQPKAKACCHAHPPHATAFAVAKVQPPTCLIPEAEVFLGQIGMAEYKTPGTPDNADIVGETAVNNMAVLMENHGVITWGKDIEDAYWKMENTDAYCRTVWVASQLGKELVPITGKQAKELIDLRKTLGMEDKRENWKECELCDNSDFRPGFVGNDSAQEGEACSCQVPDSKSAFDSSAEEVVKAITDQIVQQLK